MPHQGRPKAQVLVAQVLTAYTALVPQPPTGGPQEQEAVWEAWEQWTAQMKVASRKSKGQGWVT
jgi:hypothetical protein